MKGGHWWGGLDAVSSLKTPKCSEATVNWNKTNKLCMGRSSSDVSSCNTNKKYYKVVTETLRSSLLCAQRKQWNDLPLSGEDTHGFICWNKWELRDQLWCKMCVQRRDLCWTGALDTLTFWLWSGCSTRSQMSCPGHAQRSWIWFVLTSMQSCWGWSCHSKYKPKVSEQKKYHSGYEENV